MQIRHKHNLSSQDAFVRTDRLLNELAATHKNKLSGIVKQWAGYSNETKVLHFSFNLSIPILFFSKTFSISGKIFVYPGEVILDGKLPLAAIAKEKEIRETILKQMKETYA